jgi:hypothetical protein
MSHDGKPLAFAFMQAVTGLTRWRRAAGYALTASALLAATACTSINPTSQQFYLHVRNDTPREVLISYCFDRRCQHLRDTWPLKPGENALLGASDRQEAVNRYLVRTAARVRLGCLPLRFDHRAEDAVVRVSRAVDCREAAPLNAEGLT